MTTFTELAAERFSTRSFKTQPVEQEKIDSMLEAARLAPTAHNNQPQRIRAITDPDELAFIDEVTRCRHDAPLVFLVAYDKNDAWVRPFDEHDSGEVDASIVTTYLMLQATDLGLGSLWVMFFDPQKTSELFGLDDSIVPVALMPVGYRADDAQPAKPHYERKPLADLLI